MSSIEETLPGSAISSWGGFIYQGKVALYHCLKLLIEKSFQQKSIENFELQLDSTDDFAIYCDGKVISTHQVKAKLSQYRSEYVEAIYKAACVDTDCDDNTIRYFHVAKKLNNFKNYTSKDGKTVEFYNYGDNKHCALSEINDLIDKLIEKFIDENNLIRSKNLIIEKSTLLSELITNKVITIHNLVHNGQTQNYAAYHNRISSCILLELLISPPLNRTDEIYQALLTKKKITTIIETEFYNNLGDFSEKQIESISNVFRFIYSLNDSSAIKMHTSLQPHREYNVINKDDIRDYLDVISAISHIPKLLGLPHYSKKINKYLPSALTIRNGKKRNTSFQEDLKKHIRDNGTLASLLYEYNNIIAYDISEETIISAKSEKITIAPNNQENKNHIIKEFDLRILSIDEAEEELNAK
ncbi:ABC-three component system protein [Pseudomonas lundensis]|uniref:ABC-three component system protein n=1 Tax=Serratia proteamaculans TaxID=28151 RepID=UPI002980E40D|nr:ABC-three component system protein [Serratia proteamaculans]MDW5499143.1 ABC-three component system protein [Serratia proteamaculans]MDW5504204.1 ABC-three component system protein [Pseudomonas lundensis]